MCEKTNRCCRATAGYDVQMNYYKWVRLTEKCSGGSCGRSLANFNGRDAHEDAAAGWLGGKEHLRGGEEFSNSVVGTIPSVGVA